MLHHRYPGQERDPDFSVRSQRFPVWFVTFFVHYVTIRQLLIMAVVSNLLSLAVPTVRVVLFWMVPAFLGTFQLFYFGTFRPHRYPHIPEMKPHNARSQGKNDLWAMLSCYFFGYHYEHHQSPGTPWWRLRELK
jgi:beta-carotene ketolase (CrtW type)